MKMTLFILLCLSAFSGWYYEYRQLSLLQGILFGTKMGLLFRFFI